MKLELVSVENAGARENERIVLRAAKPLDVGEYAVFRCLRGEDGKPSGGHVPAAFWFGANHIMTGDLVVLYTRGGKRSKRALESGATSHFYYWDSDAALWTPHHLPVLVLTASWDYLERLAPDP